MSYGMAQEYNRIQLISLIFFRCFREPNHPYFKQSARQHRQERSQDDRSRQKRTDGIRMETNIDRFRQSSSRYFHANHHHQYHHDFVPES